MPRWHAFQKCRTVVSKSRLPGLDYTFNPYVGCSHGCAYCYVPDLFRGRFPSWPVEVVIKEGVLEKLRRELRGLDPGVVGVSTSTDPYQPIEAELRIVREALQIFRDSGFRVSIQTKSPLVLRDLDILKGMDAEVGMTITSLDERFGRKFEPNAPPGASRAWALKELSRHGVSTWIFYGPIIPGFNDSDQDLESILGLAKQTNSRLLYDRLNLKPLLKSRLAALLSKGDLDRIESFDYRKFYSKIRARSLGIGVDSSPAF